MVPLGSPSLRVPYYIGDLNGDPNLENYQRVVDRAVAQSCGKGFKQPDGQLCPQQVGPKILIRVSGLGLMAEPGVKKRSDD